MSTRHLFAGFIGGMLALTANAADTADLDVSTQTAGTAVLVKVQATWGNVGLRPLGLIASNKAVTGTAVMRKE